MHTTACTLHAYYMHTSRTLHAHCTHTARTLHAHCMCPPDIPSHPDAGALLDHHLLLRGTQARLDLRPHAHAVGAGGRLALALR
eukprot:scaffold21348_cov35-Phaeocystis_antarctica.AAC.4